MPEPDSLLHVLTARARVALPALREIAAELEPSSSQFTPLDNLRPYKIARYFDMLGHAEYLQRGRGLVVAPASLARLPSLDRQRYVLCGARSAAAAEEIGAFTLNGRKAAHVSVSSRKNFPDALIPNRVVVEFDDGDHALLLGRDMGIEVAAVPAAWSLVCLSMGYEEFEASLAWRTRTVGNDELKFYDAQRCGFLPASSDPHGVAVRLDDSSFVCIVHGDQEAVIQDLDWGRYWAHAEAGTSCLRYDRNRKLFAAPSRLPLPRLIARSLALCSGLPPFQAKLDLDFISDQWLVFRDIPKEIALKVADKLGSPAVPTSLNELEEVLS